MDRPAKRRKINSPLKGPMGKKARSMGNNAQLQDPVIGHTDALDKELIHVAISDIPKAGLPTLRRSSPHALSQGTPKSHRLHPRNFVSHRGIDKVVNNVVQPVQTAVTSFINVVLDQGGTSVGNVLVPAESTIFNLDGYGPVTINTNRPSKPTSSPQEQNPPSEQPSATSNSQVNSYSPQQTPQPAPGVFPQAQPSAAATQGDQNLQSPMSIQVPGSSSQMILSAPPTPLPASPSNSTAAATGTESYFGSSSSSQTASSTQLPSDVNTASSRSATTPQSLQITNGGFGPPRGNLTTSVNPSQTNSGSTTLPVIVTPISNSTSSSFGSFATSSFLTSSTASSNSTSTTSTRSSSTTSSFSSSTSISSTFSSASASDTGIPGGLGGPTGTAGETPASTTAAAAGSAGAAAAPTPTIVGSVVGSVAGLALILILLLFFLRRRKRLGQQRTISPPIPQSASTGPGANTGTMTERSSAAVPLAGAAGAMFFRRLRPGSGATATTTETTPSERGFQNLGGRKLESVLSSRGDGFGDVPFGAAGGGAVPGPSSSRGPAPPAIPIITAAPSAVPGHSSPESLDGSSFYRDSQGFYGGPAPTTSAPEPPSNSSSMFVGPGSPPHSPAHPPPGIQLPSSEGIAVTRPGPARTPVITQPGLSPMRGSPRPPRGTPPPPVVPGAILERPRDGLGRSRPSLDGSRSSRFAENI